MRAAVFRGLLRLCGGRPPRLLRRLLLQLLLNATAEGFGAKPQRVWQLPAEDGLRAYRAFTLKCMKNAPGREEELYAAACRLGALARRVTGFTAPEDLSRLVFFLYAAIGITMSGSLPGQVTVSRCYFAGVYAPAQCGYISAMDRGLIAGLYGGGDLRFTGRITEGCGCCTAVFYAKHQEEQK